MRTAVDAAQSVGDDEIRTARRHGPAFDQAMLAGLLPAVRKSFLTSALSIIVFSALLIWTDGAGTGVWLAVRIVASIACLVALDRLVKRVTDPATTIGTLVVLMGASGAVWGLLPAFIQPEAPEWRAVIVLWIFGNQSVVTAVCAADRRVFVAALASVTGFGAFSMLMRGDGFSLVLAGLIVLGGLYSLSVFAAVHQATIASIEGRLRSDELALSLSERHRELQAANAALAELAHNDVMTRLPNRRGFIAALVDGDRNLRGDGWMGIVDLDGFKRINDTWGHLVGDEVLIEAARRWVVALDGAYIARTGGDEFAFVLSEDADIVALTSALESALDEPMATSAGEPVGVRCSVGAAPFVKGESLSSAMARADAALYEAKEGGRSRTVIVGAAVPVGVISD